MTNREILRRMRDKAPTTPINRKADKSYVQKGQMQNLDQQKAQDRPAQTTTAKTSQKVLTAPFAFQDIDVETIQHKFQGRALVAHSMGLGKSFMTLLWASRYLEHWPMVVVCPATVKEVWRRECLKHLGLRSVVLGGRTPHRLEQARIYIINYDILSVPTPSRATWTKTLKELNPELIVIDETHFCKSRTSQRSKAVRELCRDVSHVLALSGTPLVNRPAELWPVLNILRPGLFPSFWSFASDFCGLKKQFWGWDASGSSNLDELHAILDQNVMVRRRKEDVLQDLPPQTITVVPLKLSPSGVKEYRRAERDFIVWLAKISPTLARKALKAERLTRLGYLRRLAAQLKKPAVQEWTHDFLDGSDDKLLLFAVHKAILKDFHAAYPRSALVTGEILGKHRQAEFDRFNTDPKCRLFCGNIEAAGVGWSCSSASTVAFAELSWVPGHHLQAADRCRGLGRGTGQPVSVYFLVANGTIESDLCNLIQRKMGVIDSTLDGAPTGDLNLMDELSKSILERNESKRS